jgi:hypothetical protein
MFLLVPLYISVRPSSSNKWRNVERIIMNLDISDIYCNLLIRNNFIENLTAPADTLHENLHAFCGLLEANFLIFCEPKLWYFQYEKKGNFFKTLHFCKFVLDSCLLKLSPQGPKLSCASLYFLRHFDVYHSKEEPTPVHQLLSCRQLVRQSIYTSLGNMSKEKLEFSEAEPIRNTDRRWSKAWPQHLAAGLAALSVVSAGAVDGWTAAGIPYLEQPRTITDNVTVPGITYAEGSWIGSLSPLGSLFGAIPAGYLASRLGPRLLMLIMAAPMLVGWVMKVFADNSIPVLYTARFILGFTCGILTVASPLYTDEIAEVRIRGAVGIYVDIMFCVGILYVYVFGAFVPYVWMSIACAIIPVLFAVTFFWMPESPMYLLTKGQNDKAEKSLGWFRGVNIRHGFEIKDELQEMQKFIEG